MIDVSKFYVSAPREEGVPSSDAVGSANLISWCCYMVSKDDVLLVDLKGLNRRRQRSSYRDNIAH